jgi:hypothetical protein
MTGCSFTGVLTKEDDMNINAENFSEKPRIASLVQRIGIVAFVALFSLFVAAGALADDHDGYRAGDKHQDNEYESKIYGIVEKLPQDLVGAWVVNKREIAVTKDTRIREKHGKVEVGAYVEVEGNIIGKTFTAYEVKVKRSKQGER